MQGAAAQAARETATSRSDAGMEQRNDALRRKLQPARAPARRDRQEQASQCWRLALARAARDAAGLELVVERVESSSRELSELAELLPERALLLLLRGPLGRLGMIALSPEVTASLIESQTIGRVHAGAPAPRRPTRIDAAMVAGWIQRALSGLSAGTGQGPDADWARGYHYDSYVDNARAMELLLEERPHRGMLARLSLADGVRRGTVLLALPEPDGASRAGAIESADTATDGDEGAAPGFTAAFGNAVLESECLLDAVLARLSLPLATLLGLQAGQVVPLGRASLDATWLADVNGGVVARARLGQQRGLRAVRVGPPLAEGGGIVTPPGETVGEAIVLPDGCDTDTDAFAAEMELQAMFAAG